MSMENEISKQTGSAVGNLAGKVYDDFARPSARQVGASLETLFRVGLSPIAMLGWGFDRSRIWLEALIEKKIQSTPPEHQTSPSVTVAISTINAISASADCPELRSLYAELLLKSMDLRTKELVHPSYVGVIGQLSPQEALIFLSFRDYGTKPIFEEEYNDHYHLEEPTIESLFFNHCASLISCTAKQSELWFENLLRLRLLVVQSYAEAEYVEPHEYQHRPRVKNSERRYVYTTEYGHGLLKACEPPQNGDEP